MFEFDFSKQEKSKKKNQGFTFDFSKTNTVTPLQVGDGAAYLGNQNDRLRAGTNFRVTSEGSTQEAAPTMSGLASNTKIDTSYKRTNTASVEDPKNYDELKASYEAAVKRYGQAQSNAAVFSNRGITVGASYQKELDDAKSAYEVAKAVYDVAQVQHSAYISAKDTNARADKIAELEAVSGTQPKTKMNILSSGTQSFKDVAAQGKTNYARIFEPVTSTKDFSEAANTFVDFGWKANRLSVSYMTENEKNVFAYYLAKDKEKAKEYYSALEASLNSRRQTEYDTISYDLSAKDPLQGVMQTVYGGIASSGALVGTGISAAKDWTSGTETPIDTNSLWYVGPHASSDSAEGIKSNINSTFGKWIAEQGLSMVQNLSMLPLGPLAVPMMASSAGGQMSYSVAQRGGTATQAFALGAEAALAEYITEKMSFDSLMSIFKAGGAGFKGLFRQTVKNVAQQTGTEMLEELTSQYLNNISDEIIMGKNSQVQTYVSQLKKEGLSQEEAIKKAFVRYFVIDPLLSAAGGAFSGGVFGIGATVAANIKQSNTDAQTGAQLRQTLGQNYNAAVQELVATGQEYAENTNARRLADSAAEALDTGKKLSDEEVGKLYRTNADAQQQEADAYFAGDTENQLMRVDKDGYTVLPTYEQINSYNLRQTQNQYAEKLAATLRDYNVKNVVVENMPEGVTGRWENGVVYVSSRLDTAEAINTKVAHEISHAAQESDSAFTNDIMGAMREMGQDIDNAIAQKKKTYTDFFEKSGKSAQWISENITDAYAADEVTADYIGELMRDENLVQRLTSKPTLVQRILTAINRLLGKSKSKSERAAYTALAEKLRAVAGATESRNVAVSGYSARYSVENMDVEAGVREVAQMEPVAVISSELFRKSEINLVTQVSAYFDSIGNTVASQQLGPVIIDRGGVQSDLGHGMGRLKAVSFAAVPNVIAKGKVIDYQENWKDRGYDTAVIAAPIMIDNESFFEGVVLTRSRGENRFYLHEVLTQKDDARPFKTGANISVGLPGGKTSSIINLLQKVREVKSNLSTENDENTRYSVEEGTVVPWEETEEQAQKAGYPVIDGKQVYPYKSWVQDKERGNYGLVVGLGNNGGLTVSFWNKDEGTRARVEKMPKQLAAVTGKYQPSDAELSALFQAEPAEKLQNAVSADDWQEFNNMMNFKPGTVVSLTVEELPKKAQSYLTRSENGLVTKIGKLMDVPKQAGREFLKPIVQEISKEYLQTGGVSDKTISDIFDKAWEQGVIVNDEFYNQYTDLKEELRTTAVTLSETDIKDFADYGDWRKHQFGRLNIVKAGGVPVDVRYMELSESYPGLFPETITHPADQIRQMSEVAQSIAKTYESHDKYYGNDTQFYKDAARNEFKNAMMKYLPELRTVHKYYEQRARYEQEREKTLSFAGMQLSESEVGTIKQLWQFQKDAKKVVDKAVSKNLMTEYDNAIVDQLLRGDATLDTIPEKANAKGIREVYEAKAAYEELMGRIREFNKQRKAALRHEADSFLTDALKWKDKGAGLLYQRETMERNVYDIVKDKATAEGIIKRYFEPVHKNEALRTKMKNDYRDRVRAIKLSRKVQKDNQLSEAAAVQLYGEALDNIEVLESQLSKKAGDDWRNGHTLTEWRSILEDIMTNNPNIDMTKIKDAVDEFRDIYNELFEKMNDTRIRNGYEPVDYRRGYFPHFQGEKGDGILATFGKALGIEMNVTDLPTTINGLTHTFRPGIRWQGAALKREGFDTVYDAVEGFDKYIEGVSDVVFHTDDIQSLRALADQIRYRSSDAGLQEQIDNTKEDKTLSSEAKELKLKDIYEHGEYTLSNFIVNLEEYTNLLANKKAFNDRNWERKIGRNFYNIVKALENRVAANMVSINPGSWLTNFIPLTQGGAQLKSKELLGAMWQTLQSYKENDGFAASSTFLTNRRGSEALVQNWQERASNVMSKPMQLIDTFVADSLVRGRYMQNRSKGLSEAESMNEADRWTAGVMADRSKGSLPTLFESKNPITKVFTQFQLEVNNQLSYLFKDIPRDQKEYGGKMLAFVLLKFFLGAWLYNELYEYFIGRRPALDPIGILNDTIGDITGYQLPNTLDMITGAVKGKAPNFKTQKEGLDAAGINLTENVAGSLPFVGGLIGGGRLPISNALPNLGNIGSSVLDIISGDGSTRKSWDTIGKEVLKPTAYILPPFGGGQLKKAYQGIRAVIESGKYSVDSEGRDILQYPVYNDNPLKTGANVIQAALFGPTALKTGQDWIKSGFKSMGATQTAVYQELIGTGTTEREAYDIITKLNTAEGQEKDTDAEVSKPYVQRQMLEESDMTDTEKAILYYGMMATEKERAVLDQLADTEDQTGAVADTLSKLYLIDNASKASKAAETSTATERKREAMLNADLTDEQKQVIYESLISDSESTKTRIEVCDTLGLEFDDFLKISNTFTEIDETKDIKTSEKAIQFIVSLDKDGYTTNQIASLGEAFLFRTSLASTNALKDFTELTSAGVSGKNAGSVLDALSDLEPLPGKEQVSDLQKMQQIADMPFSDSDQLAAAGIALDAATYAKVQLAANNGVKLRAYVSFKETLPKYDKDGNGSYTHAEVEAAIDAMSGLSVNQKAVLWQLQTGGKTNPYNAALGAQLKAKLSETKDNNSINNQAGGFKFDFGSGSSNNSNSQTKSDGETGASKQGFQFQF